MTRAPRVIVRLQYSIYNPLFVAAHRKRDEAFTRQRKLTFANVICTILRLAKKSLQIECNLLGDRLVSEPASKQAFSKARHNISYTGFKALNDQLLDQAYNGDETGLWFGYRVFGTDGSTARLPESRETLEYFGRWDRGAGRNENCPVVARISQIVELTTGITVSAEIAPPCFGERQLAKEQIAEVSSLFRRLNQPKQLFVFDRGYISRELIHTILGLGADFAFRLPRGFNKQIDALVQNRHKDVLIELDKDLPPLRLIVRKLPSGECCVILTSVTDPGISAGSLFRLYWLRWTACEEGYKKQKIQLQLENFSGISIEAVLQEFWATVVMKNLFLLHCIDDEGPWDPETPPTSRINRSVVFGSLRDILFSTLMGLTSAEELQEKFRRVADRNRLKVRPNRHYPRDGLGNPKRRHVFRRTC